jgi:hypothetical protein
MNKTTDETSNTGMFWAQRRRRTSIRSVFPAMTLASVLVSATSAASPTLVTSGLLGASGSTVGPDGALYVTEGMVGRVSRIDPATGAVQVFAAGLPGSVIGIGGAIDVAFLDGTAYVLVTLVGLGGPTIDGIYRVDGPGEFTVIADLGTWSAANPPKTPFDLPFGVQYALEPYRGGFLVTDGHHNRVLHVTRHGDIAEFVAFENIVPTGLEVFGKTIYVAQAGAAPHTAANGSRVVALDHRSRDARKVASGAPLLVDVERGRGRTMFALSQGDWDGAFPGSPAFPGTGSLVALKDDGSMRTVEAGLNLPTSLEIIGNSAYVVTLDGNVWRIDGIAAPPYGAAR